MRILIVYNTKKFNGIEIAQKTADILTLAKANVVLMDFNKIVSETNFQKISEFFSQFDLIIAIGGDGTIIKVATIAALNNLSIIGINAGKIGYLAGVEYEHLDSIKKILNKEYSIENRIMLKAERISNNEVVDTCHCLNDIVISKNSVATLLDISINIDNDTLTHRADGFIAATPTGSTAYSLSAGGPVVDPTLECMVLTAVCPHTLLNRSIVVSSDTSVTVNVKAPDNSVIYLSNDGSTAFEVKNNDIIRISKSEYSASFIKLDNVSVYKIFSEKTKFQ